MADIRLYVEDTLGPGQAVSLSREAAHYLFNVMRRKAGDTFRLFNGRDGEWSVRIIETGKKGGIVTCAAQTRPQYAPPDLWLLFAPVKKSRTDFIVEKAVELGVARICPIFTERTNAERVRPDRLVSLVREAAEQTERLDLPEVAAPVKLSAILEDWPANRHLIFANERAAPGGGLKTLTGLPAPAAILTGPEGGFSEAEETRLLALKSVTPISLGPRILRADTAAVAALTLWQAANGDWI